MDLEITVRQYDWKSDYILIYDASRKLIIDGEGIPSVRVSGHEVL